MTVTRTPDEFTPDLFMYNLPDDADDDTPIILTFQRRGHKIVQMQFSLVEAKGEKLFIVPNILELQGDTINLFEQHIQNDTLIFNYGTTEGHRKDFKFPLAGFNEKYLEQFV